jgi:hypothetical protein
MCLALGVPETMEAAREREQVPKHRLADDVPVDPLAARERNSLLLERRRGEPVDARLYRVDSPETAVEKRLVVRERHTDVESTQLLGIVADDRDVDRFEFPGVRRSAGTVRTLVRRPPVRTVRRPTRVRRPAES